MRRRRSRTPGSTCALLLLAAAGCSEAKAPDPAAAPQREPVEVAVAPVEPGNIQRRVRATGTLFGEERTTIAAKVAGRIDAVWRDVGDVVAPGDRLARVDPRDYELAVDEKKRAFEQALARLGIPALPEGEFEVESLPAVERARLQAENAKARYERGRMLHERDPPAMSDQDFADLRTAWEVAQADHRLAMLNAHAQLAEARALEAELASARQRLADTLHLVPRGERPALPDVGFATTPSEGFLVTRRSVSVGDFVQIGAPLFELVDPDPLKLRLAVPEREAPRVRVGQRAQVRTETAAGIFEGRVSRVNFAVDVRSRTFEVEVLLPNGERKLRAGSFARADIEVEREGGVLLVPRRAVSTFAGVHKVFLVKDGRAVERVVQLGQEDGDRVEVTQGLAAGDSFVVAPPPGLAGGAPVKVVAEGGKP
jgi:multidrug efflux pump subunit AcrA (membrane-fusion protein)